MSVDLLTAHPGLGHDEDVLAFEVACDPRPDPTSVSRIAWNIHVGRLLRQRGAPAPLHVPSAFVDHWQALRRGQLLELWRDLRRVRRWSHSFRIVELWEHYPEFLEK